MTTAAISAAGDLAGEVLQELEVGYTIKLIISRDRLKIFLKVEIDEPGHVCPPARVIEYVTDSRVFLTPDEKKRLPALADAVSKGNDVPMLLAEGMAPQQARRELRWHVILDRDAQSVDLRD